LTRAGAGINRERRGTVEAAVRTAMARTSPAAVVATASFMQLLAAELVGHLDGLGARRRAMLEPAAVAARQLLADEIPQWRAQAPQGGSVLWLDTGLLDTDPFVALARHHGVNIAAGSIARADRRPDPHVRICVDRPWSQVELGIRRLADAWGELGVGRRPASGLRRGVV